jgi:hypothetical protein
MGNASLYAGTNPAIAWQWPIYNTFTETINFVSILSGNITPSWKLARFSNNPSSSLVSAQRNYTNQVIITIGPLLTKPSEKKAASLSGPAQNQHNAQVQAGANATLIQGTPILIQGTPLFLPGIP